MRYDVFKRQIDEMRAEENRLRAEVMMPAIEKRDGLEDQGIRRYQVAGVVVSFSAANACRGHYLDRGISILDQSGAYNPAPASAWLSAAAPVVRHIEQWLAGEIDELAPSGPWQEKLFERSAGGRP